MPEPDDRPRRPRRPIKGAGERGGRAATGQPGKAGGERGARPARTNRAPDARAGYQRKVNSGERDRSRDRDTGRDQDRDRGQQGPRPHQSSRPPREAPRPGLERKPDEPPIPTDVDTRELHRSVRAELRGLPQELADIVAAHLLVAGRLVDTDPDLAYAHAEAARRRAARLPIVREAAAETAYASGRYDVALSEYRALRRMTGTQDFLPVMADCERALGRPQAALKLAKESRQHGLDPALQAEMIMVEAGARSDLGQRAEAVRILGRAVEATSGRAERLREPALRLRYAYADALLAVDRRDEARDWFAAAAALDHDFGTDAAQRVDELDGMVIAFDGTDDTDDTDETGDPSVSSDPGNPDDTKDSGESGRPADPEAEPRA